MGLRAGGVLSIGRAAGLRFRVVGCAKCLGWLTRTKKVAAVEAGTVVTAALVAPPEGIWMQLSDPRIRRQLSHPRILVHGIQPVTVLARGESMRDVDTSDLPVVLGEDNAVKTLYRATLQWLRLTRNLYSPS